MLCYHCNLTSEHVIDNPSRPRTSLTKGPEHAVKRNFQNSPQAGMNFRPCLSAFCSNDQIIISCMGVLIKRLWFTFAHMEIGGGASFASVKTRNQIWCASTSSSGTRFFKRCCHSPEGFIELMQRGSREREACYLQFTLQRPGDLICFPHLLAHAALFLNTRSPTILSGWEAATTTNQQNIIQTLIESTFGVRHGKWREFFRKKCLSALGEWVFSTARGPQESKERLGEQW